MGFNLVSILAGQGHISKVTVSLPYSYARVTLMKSLTNQDLQPHFIFNL